MFLFSVVSELGELLNFCSGFDLFTFGSHLHKGNHIDLYCFVNFFPPWLLKLTEIRHQLTVIGVSPSNTFGCTQ